MLSWPDRALASIQMLFRPLQDVEVFVEDEGDEVFYRNLINRIVGDDLRVARVVGLGGRKAVLDAAANEEPGPLPRLYIVDGDLEWVRGEAGPALVNVVRHKAYCIENYLVHKDAIINIVSSDLVLDKEDAMIKLGIDDWLEDVESKIGPLFVAYAVSNKYNPEIPTVSDGLGVCLDNSGKGKPTISAKKINERIKFILDKSCELVDCDIIWSEHDSIYNRYNGLERKIDIVSGKDFIIPLLNIHLSSIGCRIYKSALRMRLALLCDPGVFSEIKTALVAAAKSRRMEGDSAGNLALPS